MNLKHVEAFYWLCQLGTYQRVADRLLVTQPAISSRVRALEDFLRTDLVDRSQSRFALTERGQEMAILAERMLDLKARMVGGDSATSESERIRIAAVSLMLKTWMPGLLARLEDLWPGLPVDVVSASDHQLTRYLPTAEIDVAFLSNVAPRVQLPRHFTVNYAVRWIASASLVGKEGQMLTEADLASLPLLHYPRTSPLFSLTAGLDRSPTAVSHSANSLGTLIWMLQEGMGIAAIPAIAVAEDIATGRLVVLPTEIVPRVLKVRCVYANLPKRDLVSDLLEAAFESARDIEMQHPEWCTVSEGE
ncbi:LysR family transcriptional regulator [Aestuariibius sp. 2305UL40-4]|uniref:LysR family transcriptional regulator n=1 Tax=Aestuariibius violaceus TaxID=3234132 RepID=UPI00345E21E8